MTPAEPRRAQEAAATGRPAQRGVILLDVDGTLVDSNLFHAMAWSRAFTAAGHHVPYWRIAAILGMGGDQLVKELLGADVEERQGDALRDSWSAEVTPMLSDLQLLPGARELVRAFADRGLLVVLASSGSPEHVQISLDLLDSADVIDSSTSSEDAETSKPAPDLFETAWDKAGVDATTPALVIGDSPFDARAADAAGMPSVCLRTGGHSDATLTGAGASLVLDDPATALERLDEVLSHLRTRTSSR